MTKEDELIVRAIALCHKPFLKPQEAQIYTCLKSTQFKKRVDECGLVKTKNGYYRRLELDRMLNGEEVIPNSSQSEN